MSTPREQHAQYTQAIPVPRGGHLPGHTLVLTRPTQVKHTPARQAEDRPRQVNPVPREASEPGDEGLAAPRVRSSSLRYTPVAHAGQTQFRVQHHSARRRASQDFPAPRHVHQTEPRHRSLDKKARQAWQARWFKRIGLGLLIAFFGGILLSNLASWSSTVLDGWRYGNPRTFQTDAIVGHQDSADNPSHFTAENLHRHVFIIELVGGNPTHAVTYVGPVLVGPGQDLASVTVSFKDVNHDGKPDLLLHIEDSTIIYVNTGKSFRPATPADHLNP